MDKKNQKMKTWRRGIFVTTAIVLFLLHSPTLLDIRPTVFSIPYLPLTGPLAANNKLASAEHLFQGSVRGPESIVFYKDQIITGTEDGRIIKIENGKIIPLAQTGRDCDLPYEERLCGRPLGLRLWKDGLLYVADGYYGLHSVNISTGQLVRLLSSNTNIDGQKIVFPDDLDIDDNGNIYFSDASARWDLSGMLYLIAEHQGNGRVLRHNIYTGETEVLLRNLYFPNGIQISHDGNSLLICEILKRRILRYFLKGPKKGKLEVFVENLPGQPDNIRTSPRGTYWVALFSARDQQLMSAAFDKMGEYPLFRKAWARAVHAVGTILMAISEIVPSHAFKEFAYKAKRGDYILALYPRYGMIIELDNAGNILRSYQSPDGSTSALSHVTEHNGYLYLGSFTNKYLGKLKL